MCEDFAHLLGKLNEGKLPEMPEITNFADITSCSTDATMEDESINDEIEESMRLNFWELLEVLPKLTALPFVWQDSIEVKHASVFSTYLKSRCLSAEELDEEEYVTGIYHNFESNEILRKTNKDFGNSHDIIPNEPATIVSLNWRPLCDAVAGAFGVKPKYSECNKIPNTRQIGELSTMPVFFTIQHTTEAFQGVTAELLLCMQSHFLLLTPTRRFLNCNIEALRSRHGAEVFDVESNLAITENGVLELTQEGSWLKWLQKYKETESRRSEEKPNSFSETTTRFNVVYEGKEFDIKKTLGAKYLDYLLHHSGQVIDASDLEIMFNSSKESVRGDKSYQPVLDKKTLGDIRDKIAQLEVEKDTCRNNHRISDIEEIDIEIKVLKNDLMRKDSDFSDSREKSRSNVSKAITSVRRRLLNGNKYERPFGEYISIYVELGNTLMYKDSAKWL